MNEVVQPTGSTEQGPGNPGAGTVKSVDLTALEPGDPTDHADVFFGDDVFEKRLEDVKFEVLGTLRAEIHAGPLSPVPLALAGCVCTLVLHVTSAPEWAQLAGLLLPWAIALSWVTLKAIAFRRGSTMSQRKRG